MTDFQSEGGKARAKRLTPEQRKEIAAQGAKARWLKVDPDRAALPKAAYGSDDKPLRIGEMEIQCFVLDDERRVLTANGFQGAMGIARGGSMKAGMSRLELFARGKLINPFVTNDLMSRVTNPIVFITPTGSRAYGYEAELLVEMCEAVLEARAAGKLMQQQMPVAYQCELTMRGLARVGIVALVDEATGFQEVRKRDALHKILEAYIAPDLMPWTKMFPDVFYEEMFRLHRWPYDPATVKRPGVVGKFTEEYIYKQLPPGVIDELKAKNPKDDAGRRRVRHHQYLTEDVGNSQLEKQITKMTTLMSVSDSWSEFKRLFNRAAAKAGHQHELKLDDD